MTPADLVAEALAHAEKVTPEKTEGCHYDARAVRIWQGCVVLGTAQATGSTMPNYLRRDVVDAALAHLAERASRAEERAARAIYVARIDAEREIRRELKIEGIVLYRSLSSGTFVIRREGEGERLVDEPTVEACVARGIALGLLAGPKKAEVPRG